MNWVSRKALSKSVCVCVCVCVRALVVTPVPEAARTSRGTGSSKRSGGGRSGGSGMARQHSATNHSPRKQRPRKPWAKLTRYVSAAVSGKNGGSSRRISNGTECNSGATTPRRVSLDQMPDTVTTIPLKASAAAAKLSPSALASGVVPINTPIVQDKIVIGRSTKCDVVVKDGRVSARHCVIFRESKTRRPYIMNISRNGIEVHRQGTVIKMKHNEVRSCSRCCVVPQIRSDWFVLTEALQ